MVEISKELNTQLEQLKMLSSVLETGGLVVYNSRQVCEMLGISNKLLERYRYDGLLPFSRVGDKYWYTQEDIDMFMIITHRDESLYC